MARADLDNDTFRYEVAGILRQAVGFDWWCWTLADPCSQLPTRDLFAHSPVAQSVRRFFRQFPEAGGGAEREASASRAQQPSVQALSAATGGDLSRDPVWREVDGPAGVGDEISLRLVADGMCWGELHFGRDSSGRWFDAKETEFVAGLAPVLAARLRDGLRVPPSSEALDLEPGTIIVDRDLSLVAATDQAWRWIDRLGLPRPSDSEPLPGFIYAAAARVASSQARPARPALARLQDASGRWVVVQVAPLTQGPQAGGGYVITLEPARSEDLAPLLMRAWSLTTRERAVAKLVIDGLSTDNIATALFVSKNTVRSHLKEIFGKIGVSRRHDLAAALAGRAPFADSERLHAGPWPGGNA